MLRLRRDYIKHLNPPEHIVLSVSQIMSLFLYSHLRRHLKALILLHLCHAVK
jgi:hypothetical protein